MGGPHASPRTEDRDNHFTENVQLKHTALSCDAGPRTLVHGYLTHKKTTPPIGPPWDYRHASTVGSYGETLSCERGTPVIQSSHSHSLATLASFTLTCASECGSGVGRRNLASKPLSEVPLYSGALTHTHGRCPVTRYATPQKLSAGAAGGFRRPIEIHFCGLPPLEWHSFWACPLYSHSLALPCDSLRCARTSHPAEVRSLGFRV